MAAVVTPRPHHAHRPQGVAVQPRPMPSGRPDLRVIPGGRRAARADRRPTPGVYRRRRVVALAGLVVVLAVAYLAVTGATTLVSGRSAAGAAGSSPAPAAAPVAAPAASTVLGATHVVQPGDTLWSIARRLQPEGDVRPLVDELAERNGGAGVQVGQRLVLEPAGP